MKIKAGELAKLVQGTLIGDPGIVLDKPSKIEEGTPGSVCFLANPKYEPHLYTTQASLVIVQNDFVPKEPVSVALLKVENVYQTVSQLLAAFETKSTETGGVHAMSQVAPSAVIDPEATIHAFVVIEDGATIGKNCILHPQVFVGKNVKIGNGTVLHSGVKVYHECEIGAHCILHSNVVIGSDGFGFAPKEDRTYTKIAQIGNVLVGDNVEIGSNTCIDRGTMGSTVIGKGTKLDNLIQVAHNVQIGENTVIAAQAGIAGSAKIGNNCVIGGQVGIVGHIQIADGTMVQAQSGMVSNVLEENTKWYGSPAMDYFSFLRSYSEFKKLPELGKKIHELEKLLKNSELTKS
ncbi:MAG: UDP-3-O-(3-hydroxymyristoyl)glucosamine N-acyltransferase [Saprospiraceae bacterium]